MNRKRAIFMDRDGTISEEVGYITFLKQFKLLPGSAQAIRSINRMGLKSVVVTNQSGVAGGYFSETFLKDLHEHLIEALAKEGAYLDAIYYCPHHPDFGLTLGYQKNCPCRKPAPGMLIQASKDLEIDLSSSYLVGDKVSDMEAASRVGVKKILVMTGFGKETMNYLSEEKGQKPDHTAKDLLGAIFWIKKDMQSRKNFK